MVSEICSLFILSFKLHPHSSSLEGEKSFKIEKNTEGDFVTTLLKGDFGKCVCLHHRDMRKLSHSLEWFPYLQSLPPLSLISSHYSVSQHS